MAVRVLIADSSGIARDIMRNHLECGGCQVVAETETVAQAIDLFRTTRPDVITLDIGAPPPRRRSSPSSSCTCGTTRSSTR